MHNEIRGIKYTDDQKISDKQKLLIFDRDNREWSEETDMFADVLANRYYPNITEIRCDYFVAPHIQKYIFYYENKLIHIEKL